MGAGGGSNPSLGVQFPRNPGQIKHIFRKKTGHLSEDTFQNRKLFLDTANDKRNYRGKDNNDVEWYDRIESNGSQTWVKVKNNIISDAGVNKNPRVCNDTTGFNRNPD